MFLNFPLPFLWYLNPIAFKFFISFHAPDETGMDTGQLSQYGDLAKGLMPEESGLDSRQVQKNFPFLASRQFLGPIMPSIKSVPSQKGREHQENLDVDGITLRWILEK
jgi:hypothetical protein